MINLHLRSIYKGLKKELKKLISKEKEKAWRGLLEELDDDVWGKGYQIITRKLKTTPKISLTKEEMLTQVEKLFPKHAPTTPENIDTKQENFINFTRQELKMVADNIKLKKSPGPDGIPPVVAREFCKIYPEIMLEVCNGCMREGTFPETWKTAKMCLIEKPKKNKNDSNTYRPICLISTLGKILEAMIKQRLESEIENKKLLNENQFGFRKKRSTLDALSAVLAIVDENNRVSYGHRGLVAMVTIDIQNAFNSAPWRQINATLKEKEISVHIRKIVQSYLYDRYITVEKNRIQVTSGVPQGSVLGPTLWNLFYNRVLEHPLPNTTLIAYADDLAIIVSAKTKDKLREIAQTAVSRMARELEGMQLKIAPQKTEIVLLSGRRKVIEMDLTVGNTLITSKKSIKYMGINLDKDTRMREHVNIIYNKVTDLVNVLARIQPNIGGPQFQRRKCLANAALSVILYASPIWERVLKFNTYHNKLEQLNRRIALRVVSGYRTAPTAAILAIAKIPPIALQIKERKRVYERNGLNRKILREQTLDSWNEEWNNYNGWAKTFIKDVKLWTKKEWTNTNYFLTQALTGHGVFGTYLERIGKQQDAECWYCACREDSPEHTIFICPEWDGLRLETENKIKGKITKENISELLTNNRKYGTL
ncbi:hypothetical protein ABEB36_015563 [Hypothenemus hampei]|uniref:Reverse transcriptase domain-containing protein n=1 Tax=Hypothenemus hampei TaxID=57062 RepID=A0ABD1DZI2_HYPHA